MSVLYRLAKNYTLPISAVVLLVSLVGFVLGFHLLANVDPVLDAQLTDPLRGGWDMWAFLLSVIGILAGAWYVGEQVLKRRKFEKLLATDKRSDFVSARKDLEDLAKRLPDHYKPRIAEKEQSFARSKRA